MFVICRHVLSEWMKINLNVWTWLRFYLDFVYKKSAAVTIEAIVNFPFLTASYCPIYDISITSGFYLKLSFSSVCRSSEINLFKKSFIAFFSSLTVLEMKILIYLSASNSLIYFYIVLNTKWKIYWSEQSFTGRFCARRPVLIVMTGLVSVN